MTLVLPSLGDDVTDEWPGRGVDGGAGRWLPVVGSVVVAVAASLGVNGLTATTRLVATPSLGVVTPAAAADASASDVLTATSACILCSRRRTPVSCRKFSWKTKSRGVFEEGSFVVSSFFCVSAVVIRVVWGGGMYLCGLATFLDSGCALSAARLSLNTPCPCLSVFFLVPPRGGAEPGTGGAEGVNKRPCC